MLQKKYTLMILALMLTIAGGLAGWGLARSQQTEIAHVQTAQVFASFDLKKELEARLDNLRQSRQSVLEQLQLDYKQMANRAAPADSLLALGAEIEQKRNLFEQENQYDSEAFTQQIWTQLNQYMRDYCAENQLQYLLGANGEGNILGADGTLDKTAEVINYVNRKYRDG